MLGALLANLRVRDRGDIVTPERAQYYRLKRRYYRQLQEELDDQMAAEVEHSVSTEPAGGVKNKIRPQPRLTAQERPMAPSVASRAVSSMIAETFELTQAPGWRWPVKRRTIEIEDALDEWADRLATLDDEDAMLVIMLSI